LHKAVKSHWRIKPYSTALPALSHPQKNYREAGIAAAVSEVLGRKISYRPLTIPQYHERLEKAGLPEFMVQHFCAIALDYQSGIFSGEDKIIAEVTGQPPMTVQEFVTLHRDAFKGR
jgi:NAD(P)H dehydrogenase (quinone)